MPKPKISKERNWGRRVLAIQFSLIIGFLLVIMLWVRMLPVDAPRFHVDPTTIKTRNMMGSVLYLPRTEPAATGATPIYAISPEALATQLDELAHVNGRLIAGDLKQGFATYMFRSRFFGFPDYASIKILDLGDGRASFAVYSRLRLGRADFGVNARRVAAWLGALKPLEITENTR